MHLKACRPLVRWRTQSTCDVVHDKFAAHVCMTSRMIRMHDVQRSKILRVVPSSSAWRSPKLCCSLAALCSPHLQTSPDISCSKAGAMMPKGLAPIVYLANTKMFARKKGMPTARGSLKINPRLATNLLARLKKIQHWTITVSLLAQLLYVTVWEHMGTFASFQTSQRLIRAENKGFLTSSSSQFSAYLRCLERVGVVQAWVHNVTSLAVIRSLRCCDSAWNVRNVRRIQKVTAKFQEDSDLDIANRQSLKACNIHGIHGEYQTDNWISVRSSEATAAPSILFGPEKDGWQTLHAHHLRKQQHVTHAAASRGGTTFFGAVFLLGLGTIHGSRAVEKNWPPNWCITAMSSWRQALDR